MTNDTMTKEFPMPNAQQAVPALASMKPGHWGLVIHWSLAIGHWSFRCRCLLAYVIALIGAFPLSAAPLSLHSNNSHYFLFQGKPAVLITSGEHYGAVLNLDFDYVKYLETLKADGLNLTRTFAGAYVEPQGAFKIVQNTLAPAAGRFISPWARSATPGYANGGNKFDLSTWDEAYFKRLKDFMMQAARRGIVVELNLFCPFYEENIWALSPQKASNNINGVGDVARTNVYTLDRNGGLLVVHDAMVRKLVTELKGFDNLYYEICNEAYFGGVTMEWQRHIADTIVEAEKPLRHPHLISQNIANKKAKVENPHPAVSIFNFHYASPPDTVALNYGLNKVIGENETGFKGTNDAPYRMEAWQFILAGGGLFNNLDYSFVAGHERGDFVYPKNQPGGGNPAYRSQMRILKDFINRFDFIAMKPDTSMIKSGRPEKTSAYALVQPGKQYAIYLFGGAQAQLALELPQGNYKVEWLNPVTGRIDKQEKLRHSGGTATLSSPSFDPDIALRVAR